MFSSVLGCVRSRRSRARSGQGWRRATGLRLTRLRLSVECLEDRCLLSSGIGEPSFADPADYAIGGGPRSVTAGDFNGDWVLDLAVANSTSNDVAVFLGSGDGRFQRGTTVAVGTNPSFVTAADLNGDQILDLATANSGSNNVSILLGSRDGSFGLRYTSVVGRNPQ